MRSELSELVSELRRFIETCLGEDSSPRDPSTDRFDTLALRLFRMQWALNSAYQTVCRARGVLPEHVQHWWDIPVVSTSAFKELDFTCIPQCDRRHYFESSGTTRVRRSRTFHSSESLRLYEISLLLWFQRHVVPETLHTTSSDSPRWTFVSLTPSHKAAPHSSLVHMLEVVSRQTWFRKRAFVGQGNTDGAWILELAVLNRALQEAVEDRVPLVLAGTAFNFVHLLDALAASGTTYQLPPGSRIMETGGYKGRSRELSRDALHAALRQSLGVPGENIVTEYGMAELCSQAYDRAAGAAGDQVLRFPLWARVRVVDSETGLEVQNGEIGLVQIVDLANAFSVAAVETEDLAIRRGDGIELIGRNADAEPRGCSLMAVDRQ